MADHNLVSESASHAQSSENATLAVTHVVLVESSIHAHTADEAIQLLLLTAEVSVALAQMVATLAVDVPVTDPPVWVDPQPLREVRETLPVPVVVLGIPSSP